MEYNNENSSIDDYESFLLELNSNFTLSIYINGPVLASFTLITAIITFAGNLFVLIATQTDPKLRFQPSNIFLNSLLFGDLVMIVAVYPFMIISNYSGYWIFGSTVLEKYRFCQFVGFMFWFTVMLVFSTLAVISFDRWLFIIKPTIYKRFMKLPTALGIIVGLWITCAILNSTPFYGFGKFAFDYTSGLCTAEVDYKPEYIAYILVLFGTPIIIIVITSIWTCCFTRSFIARIDVVEQNHQLFASQKRRICGIFSILLLVCVICFFPIFFVIALAAIVDLPHAVFAVVIVLFGLLFIANPVVQSFFRPDIKRVITLTWNNLTKRLRKANVSEKPVSISNDIAATTTTTTTAI
jgi:hypothetical protein